MAYFVYILRCEDGSLYTGITTDLSRRYAEHCGKGGKGAKYTHSHRPLRLERAWSCSGKGDALRLEHRIKQLTHARKEALLLGAEPEGLCLETYENVPLE